MKNLLLSACILLQSISIGAQENIKEISLGSEVWIGATNSDGSGLYWDIFRAVFEPMGIKMKYQIRSYTGTVQLLELQKIDAFVGSGQNEIDNAIYPKWHFDAEIVVVIFKKSNNLNWEGQKSLEGKQVAWVKGYEYDKYLSVPVKKKEVDTRKTGLLRLNADRIDFFMDANVDLEDALNKGFIDSSKFQTEFVTQLNLYLAFVNNPRGKQLSQIFDNRFESLLLSGEVKKLYAKWKWSPFPFETKN